VHRAAEFGGGYHDSDIAAAFAAMSLPRPGCGVGVDGAEQPGALRARDNEVTMDIQIAGPGYGAEIALFRAVHIQVGRRGHGGGARQVNRPSVISVLGDTEAAFGAEMDSLNSARRTRPPWGFRIRRVR